MLLHGLDGVLGTTWAIAASNVPMHPRTQQHLVTPNRHDVSRRSKLVARIAMNIDDCAEDQ
jgi:hypothetical protein